MENIYLVGFMASGKSYIGAHLHNKLSSYRHFDTDECIEQHCDLSVSQFFKNFGQNAFRKLEYQVISRLIEKHLYGVILATGGGCLTYPKTAHLFKQTGYVVYIESSLDSIVYRLKSNLLEMSKRPLIARLSNGELDVVRLKVLWEERHAVYKKNADIIVSNNLDDENTLINRLSCVIKENG